MAQVFDIAVFMGDGIGPEVMVPTLDLLQRLNGSQANFSLRFSEHPAGAGHYREHGVSLPAESLAAAREADAILLSAMGDPTVRFEDGTEISPQIELRQELDLYVGLRPVRVRPGYPTPLNLPADKTIDFVLLRESTEGLFWSRGRGQVSDEDARETLVVTRAMSEKLFEQAFRIAAQRRVTGQGPGRVTCVDKANVFRAFAFFRRIFDETAASHAGIQAESAYVDAVALWMVQRPWEFDVLVTENMFGDILSDLGAGLMGGLGLAPSADIGDEHAVFQPCHGSAPDIAGQGVANPIAMILSAAMMLDWLGRTRDCAEIVSAAERLSGAVDRVMADGTVRTPDLGGSHATADVAAAVASALDADRP